MADTPEGQPVSQPGAPGVSPVARVATPAAGRIVHLKGYGLIRLFAIVTPNGDSEWWATNDLQMRPMVRVRVAGYAWSIEHYHRGLKQFCGVLFATPCGPIWLVRSIT